MILTKKYKNNKKTLKKYKNNKQSKKSKKFKKFKKFKKSRKSKKIRKSKKYKKYKKYKKTFKKGRGNYIDFHNITTTDITNKIENPKILRCLEELNNFLQAKKHEITGTESDKKFSSYLFFKLFDKNNESFLQDSIEHNTNLSIDLRNLLMNIDKFNNIPEPEKDKKNITRIEKKGKFFMDLLYHLHDKPKGRILEDHHKKSDEKYYEEITLEEICKNINQNILNLYKRVKIFTPPERIKYIKIHSEDSGVEDAYFMVEDIDNPLTYSGYDDSFYYFTRSELIDRLNHLDKTKSEGLNKLFSHSGTSKPEPLI